MPNVYRAVVLVIVAGCYSPSYSNCTISCTTSCPNSLTCDTQLHVCRTPGTSCTDGPGDAGGDSGGGDGGGIDAKADAPADAATGCTFVQELGGALDAPNLVVDLSSSPIAQGDFVVVAIAGRGSSLINTVNDFNSHQFTQAIKSQITVSGATITSAIYYLTAPAAISMVNVNWAANVTQIAEVGEWHCSTPPSGALRTGMTSGQTTATTTDTGPMNLTGRALVIASLAQTTNFGTQVQTAGFMLLDQESLSGTSGGTVMDTSVWGIAEPGNVDVTFGTSPNGSFAGTAAAFPVP